MTREELLQWHQEHPYGARTEEYVDAVLAEVKKRWLAEPEQRLGQLAWNLCEDDPFYMPDECWYK